MHDNTENVESWTTWGILTAGLGAVVCCIGPVVLLSLGVTGAWVGWLADLEPLMLGILTVGGTGYALTRISSDSEADSDCGDARCD